MSKPLEVLGLPATATLADVRARWRELAAIHHPDRGGDADVFHTLRQAYTAALELVVKPVRCAACHGTGRVTQGRGVNTIKLRCEACHGRGTIKRQSLTGYRSR